MHTRTEMNDEIKTKRNTFSFASDNDVELSMYSILIKN